MKDARYRCLECGGEVWTEGRSVLSKRLVWTHRSDVLDDDHDPDSPNNGVAPFEDSEPEQ